MTYTVAARSTLSLRSFIIINSTGPRCVPRIRLCFRLRHLRPSNHILLISNSTDSTRLLITIARKSRFFIVYYSILHLFKFLYFYEFLIKILLSCVDFLSTVTGVRWKRCSQNEGHCRIVKVRTFIIDKICEYRKMKIPLVQNTTKLLKHFTFAIFLHN